MSTTDAEPVPPPLAELDPTGQPTRLSYNVPDPTSYPGRAFVNLEIPSSWFKPSVSRAALIPSAQLVQAPDGDLAAETAQEVVTSDGVYRIGGGDGLAGDAALRPAGRPVLSALREAGRKPRFYRTLFGDLAVAVMADERDGEGTFPNTPELPAQVFLHVDAPAEGQVEGTGSVAVTVRGRAGIEYGHGAVARVEVKVADADYKPAVSQDAWRNWSYSETFTTSRTIKVIVQAVHDSEDVIARQTKTLDVVVLPGAPPEDKTPPAVAIVSPAESQIVQAGEGGTAKVVVRGSATDDRAVTAVRVRTGDRLVDVAATPKAQGDWSEWSAELTLPTKAHRLVAEARDAANNAATASVAINVSAKPAATPIYTRLMLVEQYRLSNFLGSFGAGRTLKTFSLLPGERTRLRISSYRKSETTAKSASSILDSFTSESAQEFQTSVEREQQYRQNFQESFDYNVSGGAQATWAFGSASVQGGVSGGTNATREEFAKNVVNALEKHAAKSSAKREVQVETSLEQKVAEGEETSVEREIENINLSRTLNFVFRGLNQMFWSILHLVDMRLAYARAYFDEDGQRQLDYREVTISQIDSLLADVIVDSRREEVSDAVAAQLENVADHKGRRQSVIETSGAKDQQGNLIPGTTYRRFKPRTSEFKDAKTGFSAVVDGVILRVTDTVMRTDGVIVEALLGQGEALDAYSKRLQNEAGLAQELANQELAQAVDRQKLGLEIVRTNNGDMAKLYEQIYEDGSGEG